MQETGKHLIRDAQKSASHLTQLMERTLELAREKGALEASVAITNDTGFSVDVRMGNVDTLSFNEGKSISVTIFHEKRKGEAHTSDFSLPSIERIVEKALSIAKISSEDACFGLPDASLITSEFPKLDLFHPWDITPEEAIQLACRIETTAQKMDKRIKNSDGTGVSSYDFVHGFLNTSGGHGIYQGSMHSMSCGLVAEEGNSMQRDGYDTNARDSKHLQSVEELAEKAVNRAIERLHPRKLKTQKMPVLFSSRVSSSLLSSFIHAVSGSQLYKKNSFLLNKLGGQIFPEYIKIYEAPHIKGALGSAPFDGDGLLTRNNVFVENGILKQYVLGVYSARRLGLEPTANAGGTHNLTLEPTTTGFNALLEKMDTGLLVTELMGSGVNILTGNYSKGAAGFYVEKGKILFPVEEITIAGHLQDMFMGIVATGDDFNPNRASRTGSILIEEMMVGGA